MPAPGDLLGNRYRLDDRIAAGGMGEVWRATDTSLGRGVAVKTMHAGRSADPGFETRFRHEARAMAVLHHPGVADVYDFGQTGDGAEAYIVMELVDGAALSQVLAERGRLTAAETMSIVMQAGRALNAAHQAGIVHRDVKPGNLIIQPDGTVKLVDFGVARSAESAELTGAREVIGTALYIAPEQVSKHTTGPPADVYALGAVAYHCLSGHPPFEGESAIAVAIKHLPDEPPPLPPELPPAVRALVTRAMAKNPEDRFPSAAAMADTAERATPGASLDATTALISAVGLAPAAAPGTLPGNTAVFPAVSPEHDPVPAGGGRSRTLLTTAAVALALGVAAAVLLVLNPGLLPGGDKPETAVTTGPGASTPATPGGRIKVPAGTTTRTRSRTSAPTTASVRPSTRPTRPTAEPTATTAPTEPEPTSATSQDTSGGGADTDNGADDGGTDDSVTDPDNGGSGGGDESGSSDKEAAAPVTATNP
jgi:serine/threonine-protein kinase